MSEPGALPKAAAFAAMAHGDSLCDCCGRPTLLHAMGRADVLRRAGETDLDVYIVALIIDSPASTVAILNTFEPHIGDAVMATLEGGGDFEATVAIAARNDLARRALHAVYVEKLDAYDSLEHLNEYALAQEREAVWAVGRLSSSPRLQEKA